MATAAQADGGASAQAEGLAFHVVDLEVAFHADGPVSVDDNFRWHGLDRNRSFHDAIINPSANSVDPARCDAVPAGAGCRSAASHSGENGRRSAAPA